MFKQGKEYTAWTNRYRCVWADEKGAVMEILDGSKYNRFWTNHEQAVHYTEAPLRISLWFNVFESKATGMPPWISGTPHSSQQDALRYAKHEIPDLKLLDTVELVWEQKQ